MKLSQLIEGIGYNKYFRRYFTEKFPRVCYSADKCEKDSLFVAIPGLKNDGHDFIEEAISRGAKYIVYEKDIQFPSQVTAIKVTEQPARFGYSGQELFRQSFRQSDAYCRYGNKR